MFKRKSKSLETAGPKIVALRKRSSVTVLDLEGEVLRIVQASGQGAASRITRTAELSLPSAVAKSGDPKSLGAAISSALREQQLKPRETIFCLPRSQIVMRPLQVPMVADVRELAAIINFQIAKELPFRIEDAVVDFKVLRSLTSPRPADADAAAEPEQRLEVLVAAAKRELVEFYRSVAKEAGLKLEGVGLRSIGHSRFVRQAGSVDENGAAMIVTLRSDEITMDVVDRGKLVFSRAATIAFPEDVANRPAFLQTLPIEVIRSLHSHGSTVQKVLILGATGMEQELGAALSAKLGMPAEFPQMENVPGGAAAAAGLALAALEPAGLPLDFANPKKPAVQRNTKRTQLLVAAAAVLVILFTLLGTRAHLVKKRKAAKDAVQVQLSDAEKKTSIYRAVKSRNRMVTNWLADEKNWLDHLAYLSAVLPGADQMYVSAFATTPQHLIRFSVQAKSGELLAELDKKLRAAGYEVKPLSITPANDRHGYNFRTTVELSVPKKLKPDPTKVKAPPRPADDTPAGTALAAAKGAPRP